MIYLKADVQNAPDFEREALPPFTYLARNNKRAEMSYRRIPDRLYDDPDELTRWAQAALAAARRAQKASAGRQSGERRRKKTHR